MSLREVITIPIIFPLTLHLSILIINNSPIRLLLLLFYCYTQGRGWNCCAIHGDMSQDARTRAFHAFKDGTIPLLIATDVVSGGGSGGEMFVCSKRAVGSLC